MKYLFLVLITLTIFKAGAQVPSLKIADSLYAVGNYTEAIHQYETIENPTAQVYLKIARAYNGKGVKTSALEYYKKSIELDSNQPIAETEYGRLLITRSKFGIADSIFSDLTRRYPDNPEYYYQRGRALKGKKPDTLTLGVLRDKNLISSPEQAFARAVALDSTHQKAMFELAKYYLTQKEYPTVERIAKKALESDPENIEIISVLAQNYYYKGWWTEAVQWFKTLLDMGVDTLLIREKLGRAYYEKRMYQESIDQYKEVLSYDDEDWGTLITLARLENFNANYDQAITYGLKSLEYKDLPLDDVYYTLGRSFEFKDDYTRAMKYYQSATKEAPDNFEAIYAIAVMADNYYEDKTEVLKLYEQFVEKYGNSKNPPYVVRIARERITILKREIFEAKEKD